MATGRYIIYPNVRMAAGATIVVTLLFAATLSTVLYLRAEGARALANALDLQ